MRPLTKRRYKIYQRRFNQLHEEQRLRIDDCYRTVCEEYAISEVTLIRALNMDIPDEPVPVNPNQLSLFQNLNGDTNQNNNSSGTATDGSGDGA